MKKYPTLTVVLLTILLSACSSCPNGVFGKATPTDDCISLQNLKSRVIVHCYNSEYQNSENCAKYFENKGYVRFRNIPYKTADYDFLKTDEYPSRRWRDNELTPRW